MKYLINKNLNQKGLIWESWESNSHETLSGHEIVYYFVVNQSFNHSPFTIKIVERWVTH